MSDEILEKLITYYGTGRTKKSKEIITKILTENRDKLENIFESLQELEIWKEIPECPGYEVSSHGRFKNPKEKIMVQSIGRGYYVHVNITKKRYSAHRLIASVFLEADEKRPHVHHISAIPFDNRAANLQYVTVKENSNASFETGRGVKRLRPVNEIDKDGNIIASYRSMAIASKETGFDRSYISIVCAGRCKAIKGRIFVYADDRKRNIKNISTYSVALYNTKTNTIIKGPFSSTREAAKISKISTLTIASHVNKNIKSKNNTQWRKYYEPENIKEKWLPFRDTIYEVSNLGRVRNGKVGNILKLQLFNHGYRIGLSMNGRQKHHIVARLVHEVHNPENFVPEYDVDHINEDFFDNRAINLQSLSSKENIRKSNEKSILQIDINGDIIEEFKSITDAAKKFNTDSSAFSKSLKQKEAICKNFFWRYSTSYNNKERKRIKNLTRVGRCRVVEQYDKSGNVVKRWISITEAGKFFGLGCNRFSHLLNMNRIDGCRYADSVEK